MATFVPIDEYLEYYGITSPAEIIRAELDLDYACDTIRDHLEQTVDRVTDDTVTVFGNDTGALILPQVPVVSVASVTEDGELLDPADYSVDLRFGLLFRQRGADALYGPSLAWDRWRSYTVTYTHGYLPDDVPALLKTVAFKLARLGAVEFAAAGGISQESVAGYSVTYDNLSTVANAKRAEFDALMKILDKRVVRAIPVP